MRTFRFDDIQDPECRGHHFDRHISPLNVDLDKYEPVSRSVIVALQRMTLHGPQGFEIASAIEVQAAKNDGDWHFGGDICYPVKAGQLFLGSNYLSIWLIDDIKRPRWEIAELFHSKLAPLCQREEGALELRAFVVERLKMRVGDNIKKKKEEIRSITAQLQELQAEYFLFGDSASWLY
jgi:hypothetical protein